MTTDLTRWWREVLEVRELAADEFEAGPAPTAFPRLYGGQVAAQSLVAAAATVGDRDPHSVRTTFLRGGDVGAPVHYQVERLRESRTLSSRNVRAEQGGRLLAITTASFHSPPISPRHRIEHELGGVSGGHTPPESLPSRAQRLREHFGDRIPAPGAEVWPVDLRYVDRAPWDPGPSAPLNQVWMSACGRLPDVPAGHAAALTFATDFPMFEPVLFPHPLGWEGLVAGEQVYGASLDHSLWFHRPPRLDGWLLLDQTSPVATRSRALCRGELRSRTDDLVATVVQEIAFVEPRP